MPPITDIVCIPDLLRRTRRLPEGFFDLVREPIRQGCGINIGFPLGSKLAFGFIKNFEISNFISLIGNDNWQMNYHELPKIAVDYLLKHIPKNSVVLSFEMPPWLSKTLIERDIHFVDIRLSPIRFGRDIYIALRASHFSFLSVICANAVIDEEIRLEASLISANVNMHRKGLIESRNFNFDDLDGALVFVGQAPYDASLIRLDGRSLRWHDYANEVNSLCKGKRLFHKSHPMSPDFAMEEIDSLQSITGQKITPCLLNGYQILSTHDTIEIVGISSGMLQEAIFFDKIAHTLFKPFVPMANSGSPNLYEYQHIHWHTFLSPSFWHQLFTPETRKPRINILPKITPNHGRETLDQWWDFSKVLTWERSLPYESFQRSSGGLLKERIEILEKKINDK